jgi:hypothetical protein
MLIDEYVEVKWHWKNKEHYESKGHVFTKFGDSFKIRVEDLPPVARQKISYKLTEYEIQKAKQLLDIYKL